VGGSPRGYVLFMAILGGQVGVLGRQFCCEQQSRSLSDQCLFAIREEGIPWCLKCFWEMHVDLHWLLSREQGKLSGLLTAFDYSH